MLLLVLLNIPDVYSLAVLRSFVPFFKISLGFSICYILALPVLFLTATFRKIYKSLLLLFASLFFIVDIFLLLLYNDTLGTITKDAVSALLATNPVESAEYIKTYFTVDILLAVSTFVSVVLLMFYYLRDLRLRCNSIAVCTIFILLSISVIMTINRCENIKDCNLYYLLTKECPDLREYMQNPSVLDSEEQVENIVLVIGESFSKFHSSLYGYKKETNPLLSKLQNDSSLYVYENVTSACVTTIPSIKSIMLAYTNEKNDSIEWYKYLSLIEVMQKVGYRTFWFSNQSKTGLYDNEVGRFADICDEQLFIGDKHSGMARDTKDEELLPIVKECMIESHSKRFIIVQMMGSHAKYNKRYPSNFSRFSCDDYIDEYPLYSQEKRQIVAEYDNTVLYNDSVVYELINILQRESAVVVYLSDHGEDVFRSSENYCGHASELDERHWNVVRQIPLLVYTSQLFREKHPELQKRIEGAVNRPYRTDSIMYTIMDIAGVETVNGVSYKQKSLFK